MGPFRVQDATPDDLLACVPTGALVRPFSVFALHVGGLNQGGDAAFVAAFNRADVRCADGIGVVLVARSGGAEQIERTATTDFGWQVLERLSAGLDRPLRVACVGGEEGLAERAGALLAGSVRGELVFATHGFHEDWSHALSDLRTCEPDIVILGLGMPNEALWVQEHWSALPAAVLLTCGGWMRFVVGEERRAPGILQRSGME